MAYQFAGPQSLGVPGASSGTSPAFTSVYTTVPDGAVVGMEAQGVDQTNGYWGVFKLLYGVASTVVGSLVNYNDAGTVGTTTLATAGSTGAPLAVAMAANTSPTALGWYQIAGPATIKKTAVKVSPGVALYISGTAGRVRSSASSGKQLIGARSVNTATITTTTSTILVSISRPSVQTQAV